MISQRKIELLAPARNADYGMEAILHGADAVYIGVEGFSARAAAGNSVDDIARLADFAHTYGAKVYAALNIILHDNELAQAEKLIHQLYRAKADAVIIQDMGILQLDLPPIPLHASTQADNRTMEKVQFLQKAGFAQVVLARELPIAAIANIAANTDVPLEVFVHGALCVSYSGQCYISHALTGRSANRGECAQICRLPFDLVDANGAVIRQNEHLLSLRDLNMSRHIERLLDAGVSSLKIEGRLKELPYVKNVTAAYRSAIDNVMERRPEFVRSSSGVSNIRFEPDLEKSFNRGFTTYFADGRQPDIWSLHTPKSIGQPIGAVTAKDRNSISVRTTDTINNGDGLCFVANNQLTGFRVNRAEGNRLFPAQMPEIEVGTKLFRNYNHEFETRLRRPTATRQIDAQIAMTETLTGFALTITDADNNSATISATLEKQPAQKPQHDNICTQLSKTGNTPFRISAVNIAEGADRWFIPSSQLGEWRKQLIISLLRLRKINYVQTIAPIAPSSHAYPQPSLTYLGNVSNQKSREFYQRHGTSVLQPAFEQVRQQGEPLMFTRHCIRYAIGYCPRENKSAAPFAEPLYLQTAQSRFRLEFDCAKCETRICQNLLNS